jgi:hypothetical protein
MADPIVASPRPQECVLFFWKIYLASRRIVNPKLDKKSTSWTFCRVSGDRCRPLDGQCGPLGRVHQAGDAQDATNPVAERPPCPRDFVASPVAFFPAVILGTAGWASAIERRHLLAPRRVQRARYCASCLNRTCPFCTSGTETRGTQHNRDHAQLLASTPERTVYCLSHRLGDLEWTTGLSAT